MDGGAWWAAVHGVAKSWTRLSDFIFTFHFHALEKEMATHSSILNPRDGGAWWAAIYGVAQSWTRLKWLSSIIIIILKLVDLQYNTFLLEVSISSSMKWENYCFFPVVIGMIKSAYVFEVVAAEPH